MEEKAKEYAALLEELVSSYRKRECKQKCEELKKFVFESRELFHYESAYSILNSLRKKRYFHELCQVADAFIINGLDRPEIRRQLSQGLIELDLLVAAESQLKKIRQICSKDEKEYAEATGLLGRLYKQNYIRAGESGTKGQIDDLKKSIHFYQEMYVHNPQRYLWHGINLIAMLARGERDGIDCSEIEKRTYKEIAQEILDTIGQLEGELKIHIKVSAMEAALAIGAQKELKFWLKEYIENHDSDAFEYAGTLRQMEEVWKLDENSDIGKITLLPLRHALLNAKGDGGSIMINPQDVHLSKSGTLESILGEEFYQSVEWLLRGLDRCKLIASVKKHTGRRIGTGFIIQGKKLFKKWGDEWLFVTNSHVVSDDKENIKRSETGREPAGSDEAYPDFELLLRDNVDTKSIKFRFEEVVWESPSYENDICILRLDQEFIEPALNSYEIARKIPKPKRRVYIAGHPNGMDMQISLSDNMMLSHNAQYLHYRTPTDPGSSGSPVFNDQWELIGLHRAGGVEIPDPKDTSKRLEANEGVNIFEIKSAIEADKSLKAKE